MEPRSAARQQAPDLALDITCTLGGGSCVPFRSRMDTVVLSFVFIVVALLVAAPCSPGYAQQQVATRFQYAVKTLCTLGGDVGFGDAFAPGRYRTVINIHNPSERKIAMRASSHSPSSPERLRVHSASPHTSH